MKLSYQSTLLTALLCGLIPSVNAELGMGLGMGVSTQIYRDYNNRILPIPIINYDSDTFYFRALSGGYHLLKDKHNQLSLSVYYMPLQFKPGKTDYQPMKLLDKRKSSVMAGFSYRHSQDWGMIRTSLSADILDNNNGILADIAYLYPINFGQSTLSAGTGVTWASKKYNEYYFGVTDTEAKRSGLAQYKPSDSWSPYIEANLYHKFDQNWSANVSGRVTKMANEAKNSPMVDTNYNSVLFVGVNYQF